MGTIESPRYIQTQLGVAVDLMNIDAVSVAMGMLADYVRSLGVGADSIQHDGTIVTLTAGNGTLTVNPATEAEASADQIRILGDGYVVVLDHLELIGPFLTTAVAIARTR